MKKTLFLILTTLALSSCASIVHGTNSSVRIKSSSNQMITLKDKRGTILAQGRGEITAKVKRGDGAFKAAYYVVETPLQKLNVESKINIGAFGVGNFFVPTFLGYIIDGVDGAMFDLEVNGQPLDSATIR